MIWIVLSPVVSYSCAIQSPILVDHMDTCGLTVSSKSSFVFGLCNFVHWELFDQSDGCRQDKIADLVDGGHVWRRWGADWAMGRVIEATVDYSHRSRMRLLYSSSCSYLGMVSCMS